MDTKKKNLYDAYTAILKEELVPAMGCTEPIAIAYAAAVARETLGMLPDTVRISASGNIIKNVKSVVVPNTGGLRGIAAAAGAGIIAGKAEKKLEVLAEITREEIQELNAYLDTASFSVTGSQSGSNPAFAEYTPSTTMLTSFIASSMVLPGPMRKPAFRFLL